MFYLVKTPWWLKRLYPGCIWELPAEDKTIYLTFDDGPHPEATPYVLDLLARYQAKATFFCIGKNVEAYPEIYSRILDGGHRVGNHTWQHLNGWKNNDRNYFDDIAKAKKYIDSDLFRPPYGRITKFQLKQLRESFAFKVVMWTVLSGDFDVKLSPEKSTELVLLNAGPGSIIVFHDSTKAFPRMKVALERTLAHFAEKGYRFSVIPA